MEHQVICPNCGASFPLGREAYESLAAQIKDQVINEAVEKAVRVKEQEMLARQSSAVQAAQAQTELNARSALEAKDQQIAALNAQIIGIKKQANDFVLQERTKAEKRAADSNGMIAGLQQKLAMYKEGQDAAINRALADEKDKNRDKDAQIISLQAQLQAAKEKLSLEVRSAVSEHEKTEAELRERITSIEKAKSESETALREKYETLIEAQKEEIDHIKNFKTSLNNKLVGEDLEQKFFDSYKTIAPMLPATASMVKDNIVKDGTKGDFIYREYYEYLDPETGEKKQIEILSIMYELKNEALDSVDKNRHKNADFFKRLQENAERKNCTVKVLVSTLEADSDYYNQGIVIVPNYADMYCIRPNFFLPLLMILRSAAMTTVKCRQEIDEMRTKNIDVTNFESKLQDFQESFARSLELSVKKKDSAVAMIDKAIAMLQKAKSELENLTKHMQEAGHKVDGLTVKKLTKNAPSVAAQIADVRSEYTTDDIGDGKATVA